MNQHITFIQDHHDKIIKYKTEIYIITLNLLIDLKVPVKSFAKTELSISSSQHMLLFLLITQEGNFQQDKLIISLSVDMFYFKFVFTTSKIYAARKSENIRKMEMKRKYEGKGMGMKMEMKRNGNGNGNG